MDLFTAQGAIKSTLWPASRKKLFFSRDLIFGTKMTLSYFKLTWKIEHILPGRKLRNYLLFEIIPWIAILRSLFYRGSDRAFSHRSKSLPFSKKHVKCINFWKCAFSVECKWSKSKKTVCYCVKIVSSRKSGTWIGWDCRCAWVRLIVYLALRCTSSTTST